LALSHRLELDRLVFVDESGTHLNLARSHARARRGERAYSRSPYGSGERTHLIAGLSSSGIQAPWLVTGGAVNTQTFTTYLERILCPTLFPGQVVILDNYSIHTDSKVRELIEAKGCTLLFLPTYSPDLMPIENAFSKIKALLKKAQADTQEALSQAIKAACYAITLQDVLGWFKNCGYLGQ
jgi:transposase